ncbi:MAG: histidine phosphatase family protein [Acidimicrobiales bacterium]
MARIYLARHGRTPLNAAGVLRGRLDPSLDEVGRRQAAALAEAITGREPTVGAVVASPLRRAVETARAIAQRAGCPVEVDPRLADRDYGEWAGRPRESVEAAWGTVDAAPGVEPRAALVERSWAALLDVAARAGGGVAAVVAHDAVNRALLVTAVPSLGDAADLAQDPGCFNILVAGVPALAWAVLAVGAVPGPPGVATGP